MYKTVLATLIGLLFCGIVVLQPAVSYSQKAPQLPQQIVMGGPISLSGP